MEFRVAMYLWPRCHKLFLKNIEKKQMKKSIYFVSNNQFTLQMFVLPWECLSNQKSKEVENSSFKNIWYYQTCWTHLTFHSPISHFLSLITRMLWEIVSNALLKSRHTQHPLFASDLPSQLWHCSSLQGWSSMIFPWLIHAVYSWKALSLPIALR